eukprot:Ihof_evm3s281 gene=Ihof_evmTU3s281
MSVKRELSDKEERETGDVDSKRVKEATQDEADTIEGETGKLPTYSKPLLDFDFEKLCSVSLSNQNVYACLVCGKYFQGRGRGTYAHTHSITVNHHVFINLHTLKFYCLPDNYEIIDNSLADIQALLNPTFSQSDIKGLDTSTKQYRALDDSLYHPGIIGMNNIKANDYVNVVMQALGRVAKFRDFFLDPVNYSHSNDPLVEGTGELLRKLWSHHHYKAHMSPHELLQVVRDSSQRRFQITEQSFAVDFVAWYLNSLHAKLARKVGGKGKESVVSQCFQGRMQVTERRMRASELMMDEVEQAKAQLAETNKESFDTVTKDSPFMFLTLDVPPPPLFKDAEGANVIPQVSLFTLLNKFDSRTEQRRGNMGTTYKLTALPKYLILYIKRFTKNNFFLEKNPTIVNFPVKNLELRDYVDNPDQQGTKYDLLANIVRDGPPEAGEGTYRVHILHKPTGQWYEMEDLNIAPILPQVITLSEAYLQ